MLMLALTCLRSCEMEHEVAELLMSGKVVEGLRNGQERLDRPALAATQRAVLGQLVGHALLVAGREEEAEEAFHRQLRSYEAMSRFFVRWMSSLDQGAMFLHLNKPGRACEAFNVLADDASAPKDLRIEALAGMSYALTDVGEYRRAERTIGYAVELARSDCAPQIAPLLEAMRLELSARRLLRSFEEGASAPADAASGQALQEDLCESLGLVCEEFSGRPLVSRRLAFLAALVRPRIEAPQACAGVIESLRWLREHRLGGAELSSRVEAALAFVAQADAKDAADVLGALATDEAQVHRHRHALELKYCLSRLYALHGRHVDALRLYREHAVQALKRLRSELARVPYSRFLEKQEMAEQMDAAKLQLPLRYRKAYQFITEHLDDRNLSIRQVAAHVDVTERALQMAFRSHLGMTPAELIRRRRMDRIRTELREGSQQDGVLAVASRWGMTNRSTLAQNYRQQFDESPTAMLRGLQPVDRTPATES